MSKEFWRDYNFRLEPWGTDYDTPIGLSQEDVVYGSGVITHVQALGEELPTQVKVHKSPEGSRLEVESL